MKWMINTMKQNRRVGAMKRIFLEAKIPELLMLQVEQVDIYERQLGGFRVAPSESGVLPSKVISS